MPLSNPEVAELGSQLEAIVRDAQDLAGPLSGEAFNRQPAPGRWSVGQCLEHLNITERAMLLGMREAAQRIQASGRLAVGPTRHGLMMGWFIKTMEPPVKRRWRTRRGFVPPSQLSKPDVLREFAELHDEVIGLLHTVDGYDLNGAKMQSPFVKWMRYKLGSGLALMIAHDRRHLWQAKEAVIRRLSA